MTNFEEIVAEALAEQCRNPMRDDRGCDPERHRKEAERLIASLENRDVYLHFNGGRESQ